MGKLLGGYVGNAVGAVVAVPRTPARTSLSLPSVPKLIGGCQTGGGVGTIADGGAVGMAEGAVVVGAAEGIVGRLVGGEGASVGITDGTQVGEDVGLDVSALYL